MDRYDLDAGKLFYDITLFFNDYNFFFQLVFILFKCLNLITPKTNGFNLNKI